MRFGRYLTLLTLLLWCGVAAGEEAPDTFDAYPNDIASVTIQAPKKHSSHSRFKKSAKFQPVIKPYIPHSNKYASRTRKFHVVHVASAENFQPQVKQFFPKSKKGRIQIASASNTDNFHPRMKSFKPRHHRYAALKKHKSNTSIAALAMAESAAVIPEDQINQDTTNTEQAAKESVVTPVEKKTVIAAEGKINPIFTGKVMADANLGGRVVGIKIPPVQSALKVTTTASVGVNPSGIKASAAVPTMFVSQTEKELEQMARKVISNSKKVAKPILANADGIDAGKKEKILNSDETDKQPAVKFISGDLSRNEFYILGADDPVPEKLANNPETEIAILGGDVNEAAKKIMEFKLAAIQAARARAQKDLMAKEASAKVLADLEYEEREAKANLAAAQKAMDDVKKLKKWHQENDTPIGDIVENVGPAYKETIVSSVVPDKIKPKEELPAKKGIIPIEQIAISDEIVIPQTVQGLPKGKRRVNDHVNINKQPVEEVATKPAVDQSRSVTRHEKKSRPTSVKQVAEEQINKVVMDIKSAHGNTTARATLPERQAVRRQHVVDYEADRENRIAAQESQPVAVQEETQKSVITEAANTEAVKPVVASDEVQSTLPVAPVEKAAVSKQVRRHAAKVSKKKMAFKPVAAPVIAQPVVEKLVIAKPVAIKAKPVVAKPQKEEVITYKEHDMSKVMNDLEKVVWQQKKLKMKASKDDHAKKTAAVTKSADEASLGSEDPLDI